MKLKQNKIERNKIKEEKRNRWKTIENERKGKERKEKKWKGLNVNEGIKKDKRILERTAKKQRCGRYRE